MNKNGVDDLVLLDNISETAIINTIKSRYEADLIYTYIGQVLIAVNPYRTINGLYGPNVIKNYQGRYFFEEPPHVYALAEDAYHSLLMEGVNQCIIITGESGSGKTESSKFIMQYIAAVTGKSDKVQHVKDQILESNPVLEAFGNAKTNQNYNSSRFGKYFEIQFNYDGDPTGGRITNYLLEKVRVVKQSLDERNFHIFYQLLAGGSSERSSFKLQNPEYYRYLNQSNCYTVPGVKDAEDFGRTKKAMTVIGIPESDQVEVFRLLAAILNLGNLNFKDVAKEKSTVENKDQLAHTASLFGVSTFDLEENLCNKIIARGGQRSSTYKSPLNAEQAAYSRDALAKHVYSRLFDWLVQAINNNMIDTTSEFNIGVLDIYGFEIFKFNSFEQLCINYVNEKLQQIFIELTLKSEQEEYVKEKIKWTNIDYFNNKPCVELIEKKNGVMGILDEECLFPKGTDDSLLDKLNKTCASHPHYEKPDQKLQRGCFTIKHYAGTVTYNVNSFLDKNKDDLFHNLKTMLQNSKHKFIGSLFPPEVADNKRPPSAVAQFRNQVTALVDTLMSCTPHYIRCIRPNGQKQQKNFDMTLSTNQVKYLGLLENVKVRRAGFAYRQTYDRFLHRFKMLGSKTWPLWKGEKKDGCASIMTDVNLPSNSYECGVSKIFIKAPETLFLLEEYRQRKLDDIVKIIQRVWRSYRGRAFFKKCVYASISIFKGKKERRTESVFRPFRGDYLGFKVNKLYAKHYTAISTKFNETKIIFADEIMKINPKFDSQKRLLVITDQALYVIGGMFSKIKRRTLIKSIDSISLSTLADNVVIFHVGSEYDFIFDTAKKTELVTVLSEHIRESSGNPPVTNFKDNVQIKVRGKKTKNITFQKDETAINPRYKKSGDTLIVSVATGLAKDAGRQERQKAVKPITRMHHINQSGKGSKAPQTKFVVKAMQAYTAKSARELSFQVGDEINVTSKDTQTGWWQGECRGKRGVFPSAYVSQIN